VIRAFVATTAFTMIAVVAVAQPVPQPKVGQCPSGYRESGGHCAPMTDKSRAAIPKQGQCPSNWTQSGGAAEDLVASRRLRITEAGRRDI
jgi:hypothetical protein